MTVAAERRAAPAAVAAPVRPRFARWLLIALPFGWLALFFLVPFLIILKISVSSSVLALPPYTPVFDLGDGPALWLEKLRQLTLGSYRHLMEHSLYWRSLVNSIGIALLSTALLLAVGYPMAYGMARAPRSWRQPLLMLVILPFWTSFLIRVYAWIGILRKEGLLNQFLAWLGLIDQPLAIMNTPVAVFIGMVYCYLPFMVLPLYAVLERQDDSLLEAAADLGCPPVAAFWKITVPLSLPGVVAGCLLCFIPIVGEFVIPDLLGGSGTVMIGSTLWAEFFSNRNWPLASAIAMMLLLLLVAPIAFFQHEARKQGGAAP